MTPYHMIKPKVKILTDVGLQGLLKDTDICFVSDEDRLSRKLSIADTISLQIAIDHDSSTDLQVCSFLSKFIC